LKTKVFLQIFEFPFYFRKRAEEGDEKKRKEINEIPGSDKMSDGKQLAIKIKSQNGKDENTKKNDSVLLVFCKHRERGEKSNGRNHQRYVGHPVMKYAIKDIYKRASPFRVEGIHDPLPFVMETYKKDPGEAE
jgi:hypothetical protein